MIRVTFKPYLPPYFPVPEPRDIDADTIYLSSDGFTTFEKYVTITESDPVRSYRDTQFVEAIRTELINGMVRVDP